MEPILVPRRQVILPPLWTPGRRFPLLPPLPSERERWRRLWREPYIQRAAVTMTALTGAGDDTDSLTYTTASVTPGANRLVLAAFNNVLGPTGPPDIPTVAGNGLTWVQVATVLYNTIASTNSRLTVFRTMGASPSAGTIVFTLPTNTSNRAAWSIAEFDGVDTTGTNGSGAVVQSVTNNVDAATSLTVTLAAFGSVDNATYGAFGCDLNEAHTVGAGFTIIHDTAATEAQRIATEWQAANDTTVDMSSASATDRGGIGIEIKAAAVATGWGLLLSRSRNKIVLAMS